MLPILFGVIFFVAMSVLVLAELLVPQGTLPRPDQWIPLARNTFARNKRYLQILRIAARHRLFAIKLGPAAQELSANERRKQATNLKLALEEAGGAFVKIGQLLSTRPDVLPGEFLGALGTLQQEVAPVPWDQVETALDKSLGRPHNEVFTSFDKEPFAAASIGQVHNAVLESGERVAVKVRRPGIVALIERDINIAERWARRFARTSDWAAQFGVEQLVENLTDSLREELDYDLEASNMAALAAAQRQIPEEARVRIPHFNSEFSSGDVLVMEYITGSTLSAPDALQILGPLKRRKLAERLLSATLAQIMEAGVFHSDLHPGNIIITPTGELVLLDFGSIGRIDSETRARIGEVLFAFSRRDATGFTNALIEFVDLSDGQDEQGLRRTIS
ncbi:MAG: AarF/ABC1/UbiB kinase family protein, partial [Microbacteriaceae bacterium]|nr:AarF/ABC1/UbiB kinase family protein [Microbacteriaceae bacterium]